MHLGIFKNVFSLIVCVLLFAGFSATAIPVKSSSHRAGPELSGLTATGATLSTLFSSTVFEYTATVPNTTTSIQLTPSVANSSTTFITIGDDPTPVTSGRPKTIPLPLIGDNIIILEVHDVNNTTTQYRVTIDRLPNNNPGLTAIGLSTGTLSPEFNINTTDYTVAVPYEVSSITMSATAFNVSSAIFLHSKNTASGEQVTVPLTSGSNFVTIRVTAQGGATRDYNIIVNRALSGNPRLTGLASSAGTLSPGFNPATHTYSLVVPAGTGSVSLTPTGSPGSILNLVADNHTTSIVSGAPFTRSLNPGNNILVIDVITEDNSDATYTVNIFREFSDNKNLASITFDKGTLNIPFNPATLNYQVDVPRDQNKISITAIPADALAIVSIQDIRTVNNAPVTLPLTIGTNTISINVLAKNGTEKNYILAINRISRDAAFRSLLLSTGIINTPPLVDGINLVTVPVGTTSITLTPVIEEHATMWADEVELTLSGKPITYQIPGKSITRLIEVTAEDNAYVTRYNLRFKFQQTITFNSLSKNYGDADFVAATVSTSAPLTYTSDNPAVATIVSGKVHIAGPGTANITASQSGLADYSPASLTQTLTVARRPLTITALEQPKTYGAVLTMGSSTSKFTAVGTVTGQTITSVTLTPDATGLSPTANAGASYTIMPSAPSGSGGFNVNNYDITFKPYNGTVAKQPLTITANNVNKEYGTVLTEDAVFTNISVPAASLKNGNTISSVQVSFGNGAAQDDPVGTYPGSVVPTQAVGANGFLTDNYDITYVNSNLVVTAGRPILTITAKAANKLYGTAISGGSSTTEFTATGLAPGETIGSITVSYGTGSAAADLPAAYNRQVTVSAATGGTFNPSAYVIHYVPGNLVVSPVPVTVTADRGTRVYGDADPALSYTITSGALVGNDQLTGSPARAPGDDAGEYVISQGTITGGIKYAITFLEAKFT
ncbi:cadherin-like beta sandwich domain-containing protein, partial [Hufsiella ginkgonis]